MICDKIEIDYMFHVFDASISCIVMHTFNKYLTYGSYDDSKESIELQHLNNSAVASTTTKNDDWKNYNWFLFCSIQLPRHWHYQYNFFLRLVSCDVCVLLCFGIHILAGRKNNSIPYISVWKERPLDSPYIYSAFSTFASCGKCMAKPIIPTSIISNI